MDSRGRVTDDQTRDRPRQTLPTFKVQTVPDAVPALHPDGGVVLQQHDGAGQLVRVERVACGPGQRAQASAPQLARQAAARRRRLPVAPAARRAPHAHAYQVALGYCGLNINLTGP